MWRCVIRRQRTAILVIAAAGIRLRGCLSRLHLPPQLRGAINFGRKGEGVWEVQIAHNTVSEYHILFWAIRQPFVS